jgi:2'-5' RNA ligase
MGMKFSTLAGAGIAAICLTAGSVRFCQAAEPSESPGEIVAIDVLLHPDPTMLAAAAKANAELRGDYPAGFALDELHTPHISTIQRFVRREDLERIYGELGEVFAKTPPTRLKLQAVGYYSLPVGELGLAGIVIEPTKELRELQDQIIAAVEPFAVKGTGAAFVPSADGAAIAPSIVEYVNGYVPERSGKNFNPHVTVGLGSASFVKRLITAPFPKFSFKVTGASVYHLGNYGTAAVELWSPASEGVAK